MTIVDAEVAPGEVRGLALGEDADALAADGDRVAVVRDVVGEGAADRVVLEEMGERGVVRQVVDGHDLEVAALGQRGPEVVATDAAEAVDADLHAHCRLLVVRSAQSAPEGVVVGWRLEVVAREVRGGRGAWPRPQDPL